MKKGFLVLVCVCITAFAFGADFKMSTGGGVFGGAINGVKGDQEVEVGPIKTTTETLFSSPTFGGFFFFDATYVEANLAYMYGTPSSSFITKTTNSGSLVSSGSDDFSGSFSALEIALLGKYPFKLGERWNLFPLLGISYMMVFHSEAEGITANKPFEASRLGFQGGVGADFSLTKSLFLRGEFLWYIWLPSQSERDALKEGSVSVGNGPRFKLAVGYSFGQ